MAGVSIAAAWVPAKAGVVLRQTQETRRQRPGPVRPVRIPGLDLPGRTRLDPRHHRRPHPCLPALYPAAAAGLPTLTDKGYTGAGIGIQVPTKGHNLAPDTATRNTLLTPIRALGERGNAILKTRWKALRRIRLCPQRIGDITAAALVLSTLERGNY